MRPVQPPTLNRSDMIVAFDIDDTLLLPAVATELDIDTPNYEVIAIYKWFQAQGNTMWVWSGGGKDYAERWATKLGLRPDACFDKHFPPPDLKPDICFDDCIVNLATINVRVKRINNQRKRQ